MQNMRTHTTSLNSRSHSAFMLLDAVMGICICASAFMLTFGFLHTLVPPSKPLTYELYRDIFLSPQISQSISISTTSSPTITYEALEQMQIMPQNETLRIYMPTAIF